MIRPLPHGRTEPPRVPGRLWSDGSGDGPAQVVAPLRGAVLGRAVLTPERGGNRPGRNRCCGLQGARSWFVSRRSISLIPRPTALEPDGLGLSMLATAVGAQTAPDRIRRHPGGSATAGPISRRRGFRLLTRGSPIAAGRGAAPGPGGCRPPRTSLSPEAPPDLADPPSPNSVGRRLAVAEVRVLVGNLAVLLVLREVAGYGHPLVAHTTAEADSGLDPRTATRATGAHTERRAHPRAGPNPVRSHPGAGTPTGTARNAARTPASPVAPPRP